MRTATGTPATRQSRVAHGAFGLLNLTIGGIAALALPLFAGDARLATSGRRTGQSGQRAGRADRRTAASA